MYKECECGDTVFRERLIKWGLINKQTKNLRLLTHLLSTSFWWHVKNSLALKGTSQMGDSCGRNHDLYQKDNLIVSKCESSR